MCCENCPRYTSCEEEGHLNDLCCVSCSDYQFCHGKRGAADKDTEESDGEFDDL
ncbi:MAG: hypothetical protein WC592_07205 [Candidatus Omnitrophota bacterium]